MVKSLKPTGRAIVVMSQGVLFRGQPEQTEEEDGRNQKADAEYVIRESFIKADLVECVIVLPSKLFYGNSVPGCLVVLNKHKAPEHKDKILLIWASRHFQNATPQNLLRRVDCMRILVPWRAFGDLDRCRALMPEHEKTLVADIECERDNALAEIEAAYGPLLAALPALRNEMTECDAFNERVVPEDKEQRKAFRGERKSNTERLKELKRALKPLERLEAEAQEKRVIARQHAEREISLVRETTADLLRICADQSEAGRYFVVVERPEIEGNEFNLNLPRYVDTFEPEEEIDISKALDQLETSESAAKEAMAKLRTLLKFNDTQ